MVLKYLEFQLDSADASQPYVGSASKKDWPLFYIGGKKPLENIQGFKIIEAQIPFTWYAVNSSNKTFTLTENLQSAVTVTLVEGNYNAADFGVMLQAQLRAISPRGDMYQVVYDSATLKFKIYNDANQNHPFTFTFEMGDTSPKELMGFDGGSITSQTFEAAGPAPNGNVLQAPNACQVTGPNYLYINSASFGPLVDMYLPTGAVNLNSGNSGPQVTKIPVTVNPGGILYWQDPDPDKYFDLEDLPGLSNLDFYLTLGNTSSMKPLQLNGTSFSLKIGLLVREGTNVETGVSTWQNDRVIKRIRTQ